MTIYPFRGPLVRPSTESDRLEERDRDEDEEEKGGGSGGEEIEEEESDSFAAESDASRKRKKALGGPTVALKPAPTSGISVLSVRLKKT
jgi:hypothetical protein